MRITQQIDEKITAYLEEGHGVGKILEILHNNNYDVSLSSLNKHVARIRETGHYERQEVKKPSRIFSKKINFVLQAVAGRGVRAQRTTSTDL